MMSNFVQRYGRGFVGGVFGFIFIDNLSLAQDHRLQVLRELHLVNVNLTNEIRAVEKNVTSEIDKVQAEVIRAVEKQQ